MNCAARCLLLLTLTGLVFSSGCSKKSTRGEEKKEEVTESSPSKKPPATYTAPGTEEATFKLAKAPKRIILFIGDGMGVPAVTAGAYANGAPLEMMQMPHMSLMRTHEFEYVTTDSAASATAFATGHKTHYEGVSVKPGTTQEQETDKAQHLSTMVDAARTAGWKTGLVATSRIVHATPAAFASHREHRSSYEEIALDMSTYGVDVLLGAGSDFFSKRKDGKDLLAEMKGKGYSIATSRAELEASAGKVDKLVGLLHEKDMPTVLEGGRVMSLAELTDAAIKTLDRENPEGYFLLVEGSLIDWEEHDMNGPGTVAEVLDFDKAVGVARKYASGRDDTLIVVTADHETGGLSVLDKPSSSKYMAILGGEEAATKSVASKDEKITYPAPVETIALGNKTSFGPAEGPVDALQTSFGFLSVASRGMWEGGGFSAAHTAAMVPLFTEGVGAELLAERVQDNADLGSFLRAAILETKKPGMLSPVDLAMLESKRDTFGARTPRNVILLVGDGMGVAAVTAGYYASGESSMMGMPVKGLVSTHGTDRVVNDSAATATALATGKRTRYGSVGVVPASVGGDLVPSRSVLEAAEARGLKTGLVTSTTLTHATPASFFAHHAKRGEEQTIAKYFVDMPERIPGSDGVDVAFGGGEARFSEELIADLRKQGVYYSTKWEDQPAPAGKRVLRLLAPKGLPAAPERLVEDAEVPSLETMTRSAISTLSGGEKGFFLMVEGGQIDWAQHDLERGQRLIDEITDFDRAVAAALEFAKEQGDTLVIVTADHDHTLSLLDNHYGFAKNRCGVAKRCGGDFEFIDLPVPTAKIHRGEGLDRSDLQGDYRPPKLLLQYGWLPQAAHNKTHISGPHSANFVPIFAYGPWATRFASYQDQPEVGQKLLEWASDSK
jgi:alkaline phosphatase